MAVLVRLATGLAMVSVVGFGYVAVHEWRYWADHGHNELAGVTAAAGGAGAALAFAVLIVTLALDENRV